VLGRGSRLVLNGFEPEHSAARETEDLFAENRDSLVRYLRHHLSDFAVAEDIAQESFIRFFQARTQGEDISQPRAWLFRVAHNLLVDFGRKKKPDLLDSEGWLRVERQIGGTTDGMEARAEVLGLPWHKLTRLELQCLQLRSEGLKFREVGEVLDISISTVASYVARATKKLQEERTTDVEASDYGRTAPNS
jgi:RNA polymerase sigma-70 factor (ECF subfamily)